MKKCTAVNHDWKNLIRKGRANWVCPTCNKNVMVILVLMHEAGISLQKLTKKQ